MTVNANRRLQALSQQLVEGVPDAGTFENIPRISQVASDSIGPWVYPSCGSENILTDAQESPE
jgi:hypothetical protein